MNLEYGICNLPVVPVRIEPDDRSEQVTQLLFGEHFFMMERQEKWVRIRVASDDYEGWIDAKQCTAIDIDTFQQLHSMSAFVCVDVVNPSQKSSKETIQLLLGSTLPFFDGHSARINGESYAFFGKAIQAGSNYFEEHFEELAFLYLNTPYLWGGRSPFGIDCSGFTQVLFKMMGVRLKRDARQQAEQGILVNFFDEAQKGDLAFFDNEEGVIVHVGMVFGENKIIHASGRVRIDTFDHQGIFNNELKKYTHKLRIIKRVL